VGRPDLPERGRRSEPAGLVRGLDGVDYTTWSDHLGNASGWVRMDGKPFASTKAAFVANHTLYPNTVTEYGGAVPTTTLVNSGLGGVQWDCMGWTSSTLVGNQTAGQAGGGWTGGAISGGYSACGIPLPLYCFEVDYNVNVTYTRVSGRTAFVASSVPMGGGLAAFDSLCSTKAAAAGLSGTYKAMVATTSASAASRFTTTGTFVRTDGVPFAVAADLFQATPTLLASLEIDETQSVASVVAAAGASSPIATATATTNCNDYTTVSSMRFDDAMPSYVDGYFFGSGAFQCDQSVSAYCLQQ
jgi:hypothetical protein